MADHGFDIVSRAEWGARAPRSRITRSAGSVDTIYLHWPGVPWNLARPGGTTEGEATDCLLPERLLPENYFRRGLVGRITTRAQERAYMREIQRFHMGTRGWSDFAYNYMIFRSGRVYAGRTFKVVPASQAPYNTTGVSICCAIGAADTVSDKMKQNLRQFVRWAEDYANHELKVRGHRDVNSTTCPGDRLYWLVSSLDRI